MANLPAISNAATWSDAIAIRDADTRELLDLTDATEITLRLRDPDTCCYVLSGSLTGGQIEKEESVGIASFTFTDSQMSSLRPKTYEVGILVTFPQSVEQALLSRISVLKGL